MRGLAKADVVDRLQADVKDVVRFFEDTTNELVQNQVKLKADNKD